MQIDPTPSAAATWFSWFHQAIPSEWQWVLAAVTVLALLLAMMAVPSVLQMLYGRPLVSSTKTLLERSNSKFLAVELRNLQVTAWLLRRAGVVRTDTVIRIALEIRERGTNRIVLIDRSAYIEPAGVEVGFSEASLPPDDEEPVRVLMVSQAMLPPTREGEPQPEPEAARLLVHPPSHVPIAPEFYVASLHAKWSGQVQTFSYHFAVSTTADDLIWQSAA